MSNVVYRFSCSREADLTYIGKSVRHLVTGAKERWSLNSITRKSAVKEHISDCNNCVKSDDILKSFLILRRCSSDCDTKIHEALLIKNTNPNSTGNCTEMVLRSGVEGGGAGGHWPSCLVLRCRLRVKISGNFIFLGNFAPLKCSACPTKPPFPFPSSFFLETNRKVENK